MASIRGNKVFMTLFGEETEVAKAGGEESRGRDPELVAARNEHILYKYVYLCAYMRHYHIAAVKMLRQEFYLSESTLGQIIEANGDMVQRIKNELTKIELANPISRGMSKEIWRDNILRKWGNALAKKFYKW